MAFSRSPTKFWRVLVEIKRGCIHNIREQNGGFAEFRYSERTFGFPKIGIQ